MKRCKHQELRMTPWITFIYCSNCGQTWEKFKDEVGSLWVRTKATAIRKRGEVG